MFDWIKHIRIQNKERHLIISVKVSTDTTLHVQQNFIKVIRFENSCMLNFFVKNELVKKWFYIHVFKQYGKIKLWSFLKNHLKIMIKSKRCSMFLDLQYYYTVLVARRWPSGYMIHCAFWDNLVEQIKYTTWK